MKSLGVLLALLAFTLSLHAAPPAYSTFKRTQQLNHEPNPAELLRIWMIYVGQGDGLLIQFPRKYDYDPGNGSRERVDLVIDGGANPISDTHRLTDFISQMYDGESPIIEYAVITHHDQDHVAGLTALLEKSAVEVDTIYHNGLASFRGGKRGFPATSRPQNAVCDFRNQRLQRGLAFVGPNDELVSSFLIRSLDDLRAGHGDEQFQGVYEDLAKAVVTRAGEHQLSRFDRAFASAPFINERHVERGATPLSDLKFTVLWPLEKLNAYGGNDWGETINGNSVTFSLTYKDFTMLFTGDHNDKSEPKLLAHLTSIQKRDLLNCDVFKVPHHGSSHADEEFFKRPGFEPILAVASMGDAGFKSKAMGTRNWEHPATDVIEWLGGPHRVYHTFVQERAFSWSEITTEDKRQAMIEKSHILIETDGEWFRLVEVSIEPGSALQPPTVAQTRRGNGTQWIRAKP
jgi:beta-lactamase superfamily II metal-dependent hydrolase